jgi:DNA-directed RNA polymerase specialized sigma24 family protein
VRHSRPAEMTEDSAPEGLPADHADAVMTTLHIRHVLSPLSPGHRDVPEQVYLNGCTTREAGDARGHLAARPGRRSVD